MHPLMKMVHGLAGSSSTSSSRTFIQIHNPVDSHSTGHLNRLPASLIQNWPTWVLNVDGTLEKIPDDNGFVPPASIDDLWHPIDLKRLNLRLALGIHVRQGMIRHVMPAIDLSYFHDGRHRNRGMCTVPRAYGWIDFTNSLDEWDNYELILSKRKMDSNSNSDSNANDNNNNNNNNKKWTTICSTSTGMISDALERAVICLAESAPDEIGEGSHFINVLLDGSKGMGGVLEGSEISECPTSGFELRVTMDDVDANDDYYNNDDDEGDDQDDNDTYTSPGILQVAISATMAGSESDYLPDAYKPLYEDESLRNPVYAQFKKRKENRN